MVQKIHPCGVIWGAVFPPPVDFFLKYQLSVLSIYIVVLDLGLKRSRKHEKQNTQTQCKYCDEMMDKNLLSTHINRFLQYLTEFSCLYFDRHG